MATPRSTLRWAVSGSLLRSSADALQTSVERARDDHLRRRLSKTQDVYFSDDYTTSHETIWKAYLGEFADRPNLQLLEIGVFEGRSTLWFLQNVATHATSKVTCIDSFSRFGGEASFDHNMAVSGSIR